MGRPRKFQVGDTALVYAPKGNDYLVVVVDYRQDLAGRGEYRVTRIGAPGEPAFGRVKWVRSEYLRDYPTTDPRQMRRPSAVTVYRANERLGERGCNCQCCVHVKRSASSVLDDGRYSDE